MINLFYISTEIFLSLSILILLLIGVFKNKSELKKDSKNTKLIKSYAKTWTDLLNACFRKHGANMMKELDCNDLISIEENF